MTTYATAFNATAAVGTLAVIPVSYEIRVPQIDVTCAVATNQDVWVATVSTWSGGWSGGTASSVGTFRAGAPAATALAKHGGSGLGTGQTLGAQTQLGFVINYSYQPPFDLIVAPGSALAVDLSAPFSNGTPQGMSLIIFFEELRTSWHA